MFNNTGMKFLHYFCNRIWYSWFLLTNCNICALKIFKLVGIFFWAESFDQTTIATFKKYETYSEIK